MRIRLTPDDRRVVDVAREQRLIAGDWKPAQQAVVIALCIAGIALVVIGVGAHWIIRAVTG